MHKKLCLPKKVTILTFNKDLLDTSHCFTVVENEEPTEMCIRFWWKYDVTCCPKSCSIIEALLGAMGNKRTTAFVSGEQGNKLCSWAWKTSSRLGLKMKGNMGTKTISGNIQISRFWFWRTRKQITLFQGNKGRGTPWEGLIIYTTFCFTNHEVGHKCSQKYQH